MIALGGSVSPGANQPNTMSYEVFQSLDSPLAQGFPPPAFRKSTDAPTEEVRLEFAMSSDTLAHCDARASERLLVSWLTT